MGRVHSNEVFFRDTAHGFLAWAFATLIGTTALGPTTAYLANGAAAGIGSTSAQAARSTDPSEIYVDKLFRTAPTASSIRDRECSEGNAATSGVPPSDAPNSFNSARPRFCACGLPTSETESTSVRATERMLRKLLPRARA